MAYLADILAAALGAEPTEPNVWRATRRGQELEFGHRLLDAYTSAVLEPVPAKEAGEFRPAFLSPLGGNGPDIEQQFVGKALLCAHSVAVPDDLQTWERLSDSDRDLHVHLVETAVQVARKIARYADFERSGLLHYVSPLPLGMPQMADLEWADVRSARHLVVDRIGIHPDFADSEQALMPYLSQWLGELRSVVGHVNRMDGCVDLYLPDWLSGPELLEWVVEHRLARAPIDPDAVSSNRALTKLLRLPTLDPEHTLDAASLLDLREDAGFAQWLQELRSLLRTVPAAPSLGDALELVSEVENLASRLESRARSRSKWGTLFRGSLVTGVTLVGTRLFTGIDAPEAIATSAIAGMGEVAVEVSTWLKGTGEGGTSAPYRLFVDANSRGAGGAITTPTASTFMYSASTGRPIADFFRRDP